MITLGVDVGVTGAIAALAEDGTYIGVWDLPIVSRRKVKIIDPIELFALVKKLRNGGRARAMAEYTHAFTAKRDPNNPENTGMGSIAGNSKGLTLGSTLAILILAGCAVDIVQPGVWKRALGLLAPKLSYDQKKQLMLARARVWYPRASLERKCDDGRAEALLIARYAHQLAQRRLEVA